MEKRTPVRDRLISIPEPPETPRTTSSGKPINRNILKALDEQSTAVFQCSNALDRCINASKKLAHKVK